MLTRRCVVALLFAILIGGCGGDQAGQENTVVQAGSHAAVTTRAALSVHAFPGPRSAYAITPQAGGHLVTPTGGAGAAVAVRDGSRLRFTDTTLDLDTNGVAARAYRLYQAAFGRIPDPAGLGFWIGVLERGVTLEEVALGFTGSNEFKTLYGVNPSSDAIVERYYRNVLGRAGDAAGFTFWKGVLDRGAGTAATVLVGFSESTENQAMVAPAIRSGIAFLEGDADYLPVAVPGPTRTANAGGVVTLDGSQSSAGSGATLSYAWALVERPAGSTATLVQADTVRPAFLADLSGKYRLTLTVHNGRSSSAPVEVTIIALWSPDPSHTPARGNFIYLESDARDFIGDGKRYLYTTADSQMRINPQGPLLIVSVAGDEYWDGNFRVMDPLTRLERGYYGDLNRFPFHDSTRGGLLWWGNGRGCSDVSGWFVVDSVTYEGATMTAIDLRFEQHCEGNAPALRGRLRWSANDAAAAPGPAAVPEGLWQPAAGPTPSDSTYVYLESARGDYIGAGRNYTYTKATASMTVQEQNGLTVLRINGDQDWVGEFMAMQGLTRLEKGYYAGTQRYPFHNPARGGLTWGGDGRGCNRSQGWFVVDDVSYSGAEVTLLDLRFEQHCESSTGVLRGKVRWRANDGGMPPGPATPPASLWRPDPAVLPASGNYLYLQSTTGDYVGGGRTWLHTGASARWRVDASGAHVDMGIDAGNAYWVVEFKGMDTLSELKPGYYSGLHRYPFYNPAKGGMTVSGNGVGCNTLEGWFVVDSISYLHGVLKEIDVRFEQYCDGAPGPMRGKVRWKAADVVPGAGPIV